MAAVNIESKLDCDVIVIGAGLAGCAAAIYMAKAGLKVVVLEQQTLPSEGTLCQFVSPGALKELEIIGLASQPNFQASNTVNSASVYLSSRELVADEFPSLPNYPKNARLVKGGTFEGLMLEAAQTAGATVHTGTQVINFAVEKDWVTVLAEQNKEPKTYRGRLLVGADGSGSSVARILKGAPWANNQKAAVARAHFVGVAGSSSEAALFFGNDSFPGYSWIFPTAKGEADVGVGLVLGTNPLRKSPEELLMSLIENDQGMKGYLKDARLTSDIETSEFNLYDIEQPLVDDRVLLIGAAAGLVNPYNGEGAQMALLSAKWAAKTATACKQKDDFSSQALSAYSGRIMEEFGYGFKLSALTLDLIRNRNLNQVWLKWFELMGQKCRTDPEFAHLASGVMSGMIFPNEATSMRIVSQTLQEAVASVGLMALTDLGNPAQAQQDTINLIQTGAALAEYAVREPFSLLEWGMNAIVRVGKLAADVPLQSVAVLDKKLDSVQ